MMLKRHGLSHMGATLISILASGFLVRTLFIKFPVLYNNTISFCDWIKDWVPLPLTNESLAVMLLASFFAFLWGITFFYVNDKKYGLKVNEEKQLF